MDSPDGGDCATFFRYFLRSFHEKLEKIFHVLRVSKIRCTLSVDMVCRHYFRGLEHADRSVAGGLRVAIQNPCAIGHFAFSVVEPSRALHESVSYEKSR